MSTVLPFPLVGLGSIAPAPADLQPRAQARMKLALKFSAAWELPAAGAKARAKLALRFRARAGSRAAAKMALRFNALWRAPASPSKARMKLALRLNATGSSVTTWGNGYTGQIELRQNALSGGATVANALLPVIIVNPALRTVANGGLSQNAGLDVQLETTGGTPLGYVRLAYDGASGLWAGLANVTSRAFGADESLMLYVGKAAASGANAVLARGSDWLAWLPGGSVTDLTGLGHSLVNHGATVGSLDGLTAWLFNGVDQYLDQASSSYLNGLAALTAVQVYEPTVENESRELWNVAVGTAGELGFRLKSSTRRLIANAKFGASTLSLESADNTAPAFSGFSPFVHRYPLRIESAAPGDIVVPGSFSVLGINTYSIAAGKVLDCRGLRARHHDPSQGINIASFRLTMGDGSTFTGATSYTTNTAYLAMPWGESHGHPQWDNPPGIRIDSAPAGAKIYIEGVDLRDNIDCIIPSSSVPDTVELYFNAVRIPGCPDDPWQNDNGRGIKEIKNSLIVGHTTLSERPGFALGNTIKYRHCLIWKKRRRWNGDEKWYNGQYTDPGASDGYVGSRKVGEWLTPAVQNNTEVVDRKGPDGWGHQGLWKFGSGDTIIDMEDCLIRVDTIPVDGPTGFFLPNAFHVMNRVTLLWMQGGTCPLTPIPPGVTVITDTNLCYSMWNQAYADWHTVNGFNATTDDLDWTRP